MASKSRARPTAPDFKPIPRVAVLMETTRSFGRDVIRGIAKYAKAHGPWNMQLHLGDLGQNIILQRGWPLDAVIGRIDDPATLKMIKKRRMAAVCLVDNALLPPPIITNCTEICQLAFEHLRSIGHRRFAYYDQYTSWGIERGRAFGSIAAHAGFEWRPCPGFGRRLATRSELIRWLIALPKPIGLFTGDDLAGREIIDVCGYADVAVPEQIAVVGVDNDELICGICYPSLSSVKLDAQRIGYEGAATLDQLLSGGQAPSAPAVIAPLGVQVRQSSDAIVIDDPVVAQASRFIREYAVEGIQIQDVLEITKTSRRSLELRFRKATGHSPHDDILKTQLNRACELLAATDMKLNAIAAKAGFSSPEYFHRAFRRAFALTPKTFRMDSRRTGT